MCLYKKVNSIHEGTYFGELGLFTGDKRSATIMAGTDMNLGYLSKDDFMYIFGESFTQMNFVLQVLR